MSERRPHVQRRARRALALACLLALAAAVLPGRRAGAPLAAAASVPALEAQLAPQEVAIGAGATVSGRALQGAAPVAAAAVALQAEGYPFDGYSTVQRATTAADGSFAFVLAHAERNTRLRVVLEGAPAAASEPLLLTVDPSVAAAARVLGPGRTLLAVRLRHTTAVRSDPVPAFWSLSPSPPGGEEPAPTQTRELAPGITYASAVVDPPARSFSFSVCVNPTWEHAMGARAAHGRCPRGPLYGGRASGVPLPTFPSAAALAAAARFLSGRAGRTSFAVIDSSGRAGGVHLHEHFESASVVKVMMLTAYLQMIAAAHRSLDGYDTSVLYPMIHVSDNEAASEVLARVGSGALQRVAREAGMSDYAPGVGWWAYTQTSAIDQARLFAALPRLIPQRFYGYARYLLSTIEPSQSWGIPPVARPRWQVLFKTGALPSQGLFNEAARLEQGPASFELAVFTDGDPSMEYGERTIEGVAAALLAPSS